MIKELNNLLYEKNSELSKEYINNKYPIYFIIAQPRGVSTLFQQLITSNLELAYISNFLAKFYKAPLFGLELEKDVLNKNYKSNYISNYGNTIGKDEPHEWGWFWQEALSLNNKEHYTKSNDFSFLVNSLSTISNKKALPLIIDNVFAMANILKFKDELNNIRIINITRDLYFICNSIINARLSRYNNINTFYGHTPQNINEILEKDNPIEQIVFQVHSIQKEIDNISKSFDKKDIFNIDYENIFSDSYDAVNKFSEFMLYREGISLNKKEKHLPKLTYRNDTKLINKKYKEELDYYFNKYFGEKDD